MSDIQEQEDNAPGLLMDDAATEAKRLYEYGMDAQRKAREERKARGLSARACAEEREQRLQLVHQLLRKGLSPGQIHEELEARYHLKYEARAKILKEARQRLVRLWDDVAREELAATLMDRFDMAFNVGMDNKQVGAAIGALQAQARMVGIDQPGGSYSKKKNKRST
jgi:DNA-binding transcriptional MerR regulator